MEIENKKVGRNLQKFRMLRDMKAADLAERIGMKETTYSTYERGESKITIDFLQKVATALNVDPIAILATSPDNFIETMSNSPLGGIANTNNVDGDVNTSDPRQQDRLIMLMETQNELLKELIKGMREKK